MSCNPAVGGLAKGQMVREVDALGGEMAKITDAAGLQFRMLNTSRGPAVRSPRVQCDKLLYHKYMLAALEKQGTLELIEDEASEILLSGRAVSGIRTKSGKNTRLGRGYNHYRNLPKRSDTRRHETFSGRAH